MIGTFKVFHLYGEEGKFRDGLKPLLRLPFHDVTFFKFAGELLDVITPSNFTTFLYMFHREYLVMFVTHVAQSKVCGRAIGGCGQHHLHHDSGDI